MKIDLKQIKLIKTLQGKLKLSDEVYRDILWHGFNVKSAKELNLHQANELIANLEEQAVKGGVWTKPEKGSKTNKWKYNNFGDRPGFANPKQLRMLNAMWHTSPYVRIKTDAAFEAFIFKRISKIDHLKWLPQRDVRKIKLAIESLGGKNDSTKNTSN